MHLLGQWPVFMSYPLAQAWRAATNTSGSGLTRDLRILWYRIVCKCGLLVLPLFNMNKDYELVKKASGLATTVKTSICIL